MKDLCVWCVTPQEVHVTNAQNYFAVQTRKFEIIEKRIQEFERIKARQKQK